MLFLCACVCVRLLERLCLYFFLNRPNVYLNIVYSIAIFHIASLCLVNSNVLDANFMLFVATVHSCTINFCTYRFNFQMATIEDFYHTRYNVVAHFAQFVCLNHLIVFNIQFVIEIYSERRF